MSCSLTGTFQTHGFADPAASGVLRTLELPFPRVGKLRSEDLPPARLQDDVRRRPPPTDAPPSTAILKGLIGLRGIREAVTIREAARAHPSSS